MIDEIIIRSGLRRLRVFLLSKGEIVEFFIDRKTDKIRINDIYIAKILTKMPGINGFFVDLGETQQAFLPKREARDKLNEGEKIIVQVTRVGTSGKGPRVSKRVRLPGHTLILEPGGKGGAISKKIKSLDTRKQLYSLANQLSKAGGDRLILRSAAEGIPSSALLQEAQALRRRWISIIEEKHKFGPVRLWRDSAVSMAIRDYGHAKIKRLVGDNVEAVEKLRESCVAHAPYLVPKIQLANSAMIASHENNFKEQFSNALDTKIHLSSGAWITIESTAALTAIDVNAGRYSEQGEDAERIALETNIEAAAEIARQIRLRDIGGIIVIDFINLSTSGAAQDMLRALKKSCASDPADIRISGFSEFGLVEVTRQYRRATLASRISDPCELCSGTGRQLNIRDIADDFIDAICVTAASSKNGHLKAFSSKAIIEELGSDIGDCLLDLYGIRLTLQVDPSHSDDTFEVVAF